MTDGDPSGLASSPGESQPAPETYDKFVASRSDPRFTDQFRDRVGESRDSAITYRPTRKLVADELADDTLRQYLVQDYTFVETLVGAFGHAVGTASMMVSKLELVPSPGILIDDEDDYFLRAFDTLDAPESVYSEPKTMPTTCAFINLLERTARQGGYAEMLAVLVPAEWVCLSRATAVADAGDSPSRFYPFEWVDFHATDGLASSVEWLRTELDREGAATSLRRQRWLEQLLRRTVGLEVTFFDEAYELGRGPSRPGDDR